ncbi:MAG: cysteine desulfurase NifS [Lachnospiraceae bacterium]|nr:cysteine desulfurase NifS [Lachnospiraceae bacterium]
MEDKKQRIYLDNAATTRVSEEVLQEMLPWFRDNYANPSAIYGFAGEAKKAVGKARERAAALIGAKPNEIYFTAGGSESDNWAIRAVAEGLADKGRHIITSKIEHHAVLHTCEYLEKQGYEVTYLDVDSEGKITPEALQRAIRPDTILISLMAANNEIGTIEPLAKIGEIAHERGVLFHTDAVQAYGHIPLDTDKMHIDLLSASGHKLNGPKGVGILYCRENVRLRPFIHGGAQERGRRAGTLNVPGIVGFGKAAELAGETMQERTARETALRDYLIDRVLAEIPYTRLNGHRQDRLSNNASFCFRFIEGESLLILLDQKGICGSSGSACTSGALDPSHVLLAIGLPHEIAHGSLRLTLSEENTEEQLSYVVETIKEIVERLRGMSPLYEDFLKQEKGNFNS